MSEKEKRSVRPWDLFNKNMNRAPSFVQQQRHAICKDCPFYRKKVDQCKKCGCIMNQKTKLADAFCPVHKWDVYELDVRDVPYNIDLENNG
jgi:hypothetical protein